MGCGILTTYPQIAALYGVQGLLVYGISSALPIMLFAFAGPAIRKRCPDGFVLTEWVRQRYGMITSLYLSFFTIVTMFLYMVAELSAVQLAINSLTGLDALPCLIIECVVTTIYTAWGGFQTSFFTDKIQGIMVFLLLIVCTIAFGTQVDIDRSLIDETGLLKGSLVGYQLIYILPVAIATNDCFLSGFWLRTFASKTNKDLFVACGVATIIILVFLVVIGVAGMLAVWSGKFNPLDPGDDDGSMTLFQILIGMPGWVIGFVLVFTVSLSTATFDSLQSAMASSLSNDVFRNKLPLIWIRVIVVLIMVPSVVVAIKAPNVLQIFLISDLISAAVVPALFLGLSEKYFWFISGWEVIVSGLGGILSVFIFGAAYYGSAEEGGKLILLENGLYVDDWSAFGAFVAAPIGGLIFGFICLILRWILEVLILGRTMEQFHRSQLLLTSTEAKDGTVVSVEQEPIIERNL